MHHLHCGRLLSYRDLEEMMRERGLSVDHTTIFCWVQHYAPELEKRCRLQPSRYFPSLLARGLPPNIPRAFKRGTVPVWGTVQAGELREQHAEEATTLSIPSYPLL
jgi:hypothetical protein